MAQKQRGTGRLKAFCAVFAAKWRAFTPPKLSCPAPCVCCIRAILVYRAEGNHIFVIGATQIESESQAPASVRSGLELLSALYAVHPAFGEANLLELATGLRPTLNHHNPEIRFNRGTPPD